MNLNFAELEAKAIEQSEARAESFKKHLAETAKQESRAEAETQRLIAKAGERCEAKMKAAVESQVDIAIENAKKRDTEEWDDERKTPYKNLLENLMGSKQ